MPQAVRLGSYDGLREPARAPPLAPNWISRSILPSQRRVALAGDPERSTMATRSHAHIYAMVGFPESVFSRESSPGGPVARALRRKRTARAHRGAGTRSGSVRGGRSSCYARRRPQRGHACHVAASAQDSRSARGTCPRAAFLFRPGRWPRCVALSLQLCRRLQAASRRTLAVVARWAGRCLGFSSDFDCSTIR